MSDISFMYWFIIIVYALLQISIFSLCFDENKKFKNIKGTTVVKAKYVPNIILIFLIPFIYTSSFIEWFDILRTTIFIAVFMELHYSNNEKKILSYKNILILISFYSLIIYPDDIEKIFLVYLLNASMDTCMNLIGKYIEKLIPYEAVKLRYPKSVSGNKTGLSVILSYITMLCVYSVFFDFWLISLVCFSTFLGDAIFSHYKRLYNIDDFSNMLGPTGGFIDRFDGLIITIAIIATLATLGIQIVTL